MTLQTKEYHQFIKVKLHLLYYVGQKLDLLPFDAGFEYFKSQGQALKISCRDKLLVNMNLVDDYLSTFFDDLSTEEIRILVAFKHSRSGNFVILHCFSECAVLLDTSDAKVYRIKALSSNISDLFDRFPVCVHTTLVPYNDQIVYDGFMKQVDMHFDDYTIQVMQQIYQDASRKNKLLTTMGSNEQIIG